MSHNSLDKRFPLHWPVCHRRSLPKRPTVQLDPLARTPARSAHPLFNPLSLPGHLYPPLSTSIHLCRSTSPVVFVSPGKCGPKGRWRDGEGLCRLGQFGEHGRFCVPELRRRTEIHFECVAGRWTRLSLNEIPHIRTLLRNDYHPSSILFLHTWDIVLVRCSVQLRDGSLPRLFLNVSAAFFGRRPSGSNRR